MLTLEDHQLFGANWLAQRKRGYLADEMGVGKSAQAIHCCTLLGARNITVLCPAIGCTNWANEFGLFDFLDRDVNIIQHKKDPQTKSGINITSYNLATNKTVYQALSQCDIDVLILDEAHYVRNRDALRTKIVYGSARNPRIVGLANKAEFVYALSGTPMPKNPGDLYTALRFYGGYAKTYDQFCQQFCTGYYEDNVFRITGIKQPKKLKQLLHTFMLRRRLSSIMTNPVQVIIKNHVIGASKVDDEIMYGVNRTSNNSDTIKLKKATEKLNHIAKQQDNDLLNELKNIKLSRHAPVPTLRRFVGLQKTINAAAYIKHCLDNYVDNMVVYAIHRDVITWLAQLLKLYNPGIIYGGTPQKKKDARILKFEREQSRVLICNIEAAGTNVRFKTAQQVTIVEPAWNPDDNAQAISRCLWLTRTTPLPVTFISLSNSFDNNINAVLARKTEMSTQIFHDNIGNMNND